MVDMGVLSYSGVRDRVRLMVRDGHALLLDDTMLDELIDESQREYALLSGSLTGEAEVSDSGSGVWDCPHDWISSIRFTGIDGLDVPFYSWKNLHDKFGDFREITGDHVQCVIPDFDGFGKIRMFPKSREPKIAGKIYYKRIPAKGKFEVTNIEAVVQYVLYLISTLTGKNTALAYYKKFLELVNHEGNQLRGIGASRRIRRGRFF